MHWGNTCLAKKDSAYSYTSNNKEVEYFVCVYYPFLRHSGYYDPN